MCSDLYLPDCDIFDTKHFSPVFIKRSYINKSLYVAGKGLVSKQTYKVQAYQIRRRRSLQWWPSLSIGWIQIWKWHQWLWRNWWRWRWISCACVSTYFAIVLITTAISKTVQFLHLNQCADFNKETDFIAVKMFINEKCLQIMSLALIKYNMLNKNGFCSQTAYHLCMYKCMCRRKYNIVR